MNHANLLRRHKLFDARLPRYTSYPPANRFAPDIGARNQEAWLASAAPEAPISLYIHIPFCRRLCWFCACRTQGTRTLAPLTRYVDTVLSEIAAMAPLRLPAKQMIRLHLGGGTPTLLPPKEIERLLSSIFARFEPAPGFEFSVEVDPTDAPMDVLKTLARWGMRRASIGVQDFDETVQAAIGRSQSLEETRRAAERLRDLGTTSLNFDLLFGLPHQTEAGLLATLERALLIKPDRFALYGYAHVPHMSKRQVMIDDRALPGRETRYAMSEAAKLMLLGRGYDALGIDHYARPSDSLSIAAREGRMTRNFQGYTDDPSETLIGFGASAISKFRQGFVQNAVSTSAYAERIAKHGRAGHKGIALTDEDRFTSAMIEALMCRGQLSRSDLVAKFPARRAQIEATITRLMRRFPDLLRVAPGGIEIRDGLMPAARAIAAQIDGAQSAGTHHAPAI